MSQPSLTDPLSVKKNDHEVSSITADKPFLSTTTFYGTKDDHSVADLSDDPQIGKTPNVSTEVSLEGNNDDNSGNPDENLEEESPEYVNHIKTILQKIKQKENYLRDIELNADINLQDILQNILSDFSKEIEYFKQPSIDINNIEHKDYKAEQYDKYDSTQYIEFDRAKQYIYTNITLNKELNSQDKIPMGFTITPPKSPAPDKVMKQPVKVSYDDKNNKITIKGSHKNKYTILLALITTRNKLGNKATFSIKTDGNNWENIAELIAMARFYSITLTPVPKDPLNPVMKQEINKLKEDQKFKEKIEEYTATYTTRDPLISPSLKENDSYLRNRKQPATKPRHL